MFKHWLCGLNFVVGYLLFFLVNLWLATGENLPSKWSMPDPRGGPQNAVNVFLWGWVKPDPRGSACLHKEDCVHINITVASGPGTYWPCKRGRFHLMPLRLKTAGAVDKNLLNSAFLFNVLSRIRKSGGKLKKKNMQIQHMSPNFCKGAKIPLEGRNMAQ